MRTGVVYTETVVHGEAPFQLAIINLDEGGRLTARIAGERVAIGDAVEFVEDRGGVAFFRLR